VDRLLHSPAPLDTNGQLTLESLAAEVAWLHDAVTSGPSLCRKDIMRRYNIAEATLHRWMRAEKLPQPVRISGPRWRLADILQWEQAGRLPRPVSGQNAP
jgi:predicted DNA-binding transcriptional regulator AlpA